MPIEFKDKNGKVIVTEWNDRLDAQEEATRLGADSYERITKWEAGARRGPELNPKKRPDPPQNRINKILKENELLKEILEEELKLPKGDLDKRIKDKLNAK